MFASQAIAPAEGISHVKDYAKLSNAAGERPLRLVRGGTGL